MEEKQILEFFIEFTSEAQEVLKMDYKVKKFHFLFLKNF